ncbi:hypothetical protein OHA61_39000 [Streptomyces sp. NBC_00885]|uniref:hypothetical protein n=1 Tax=Streptomyces sp. NBC_00885 TaxID=2975857 RepID=UPI0038673662|nr:hypothetical protein OHA61_39000 [Streptomyces sp. NBC_00885]
MNPTATSGPTTPADPNFNISYVDATGTTKTTTCATRCLLFHPGGPTTHRPPRLAGTSNWDATITNIFWLPPCAPGPA